MSRYGSCFDRKGGRAAACGSTWGPLVTVAFLGAAVLLGLLPARVCAQRPEPALPDPKAGYSWQNAAKKAGLDATDVEQVAKQKVLVSHETFKQVFTPYIHPKLPVFITSDSVLNAYHVLFEESIQRLEKANARRLPEVLRIIWRGLRTVEKGMKVKPETAAAAMTRARVAIGTAMRLLGIDEIKPEPKIAAWIDEEVKRVTAASGQHKAAWLGPPDPGFMALDYTRYKPRGFYTKTEALSRYFRAVAWLQSIPFRVNKDDELLAILVLGKSLGLDDRSYYNGRRQIDALFDGYEPFFGAADDRNLLDARSVAFRSLGSARDTDSLQAARKAIKELFSDEEGSGPQINDQLGLPPEDPTKAAEPSYRILAAWRTPDGVLFGRTTDIRRFQPRMPTGLEVATMLGSRFAHTRLTADPQGKALLAEIDRPRRPFIVRSLYTKYLICVAALFEKPEPDAPRFMSSEAWQIKSCQTVLGGWAQLRHAWALQAKQSWTVLDGALPLPGFLEPVPEFYSRLAQLAEDTHRTLKRADAFAIDPREVAAEIRMGIPLVRRLRAARASAGGNGKKGDRERPSLEESEAMEKVELLMSALAPDEQRYSPKETEAALGRLEKLAGQMEKEGFPASGRIADAIHGPEIYMDYLWRELARLCRRLEALSHKQLRGVAFNWEEDHFLGTFGELLGATMLYGGNCWMSPRDDAPRVIDVHTNPNTGAYLEIAIGRPRAIYVLYPYQGAEILCRGAVMPYFEFAHGARLTDAEWKTMLDSPTRPPLPGWASSIYSTRGRGRPEMKADHR